MTSLVSFPALRVDHPDPKAKRFLSTRTTRDRRRIGGLKRGAPVTDHLPREGHTLFATEGAPRRYFLIPDGTEVPEGPLAMSSLTGRRLSADPDIAALWEVEEAEARVLAGEQMERALRRVGSAMSGMKQVLEAAGAAQKAGTDAAAEARRAAQRQRVAETLGVTAGQLGSDPAAVKAGLEGLLGGLRTSLTQLASERPADQEAVKRRAEALAQKAREQGLEGVAGPLEQLPERLGAMLRDPKLVAEVEAAAARLKAAAAELRGEEPPTPE